MKNYLLLSIFSLITYTCFAQDYCIENRFNTANYFSADQIQTEFDKSYGLASVWYQNIVHPEYNYFDIAYPKLAIDNLTKKPAIIFFHGGGFADGDKSKLLKIIQSLAQRGFVAASANYRIGWETNGQPSDCHGNPTSLTEAFYKALQDVDACMRFITYHADEFGIDTAQIYMGSQSAGGICVFTKVFASQNDINALFPYLQSEFGEINASTNTINIAYHVKGIINMWGAISDTNFIKPYNAIPVISFYGDKDKIVPPDSGPVQGCITPEHYMTIFGSKSICTRLKNLNTCYIEHENPSGLHEAYSDDYTIPNIACFVKSILCNACTSGTYAYEIPECEYVPLGIDNTGFAEDKIAIFPNPATSSITVTFPQNIQLNATVQIAIYNMAGQRYDANVLMQTNSIRVDLSNLPAGIYILRETNNTLSYQQKISVVK